ncbi:MAG: adenylyltransferase, partial [Desulfobacteraceae bacterium]|nr:adenylyltransferase [Desulfobacteraceae bacterium]
MKENELVNLLVDEEQHQILKELTSTMPDVILNERQICDFELLVTGVFSPLKGFMTRMDYESVLDRMRLTTGELWPVPICLDVHEALGRTLEAGQSVVLRDPEGFLLAVMTVADVWPMDRADKEKEALAVYNTLDKNHPGVDYLFNQCGTYYIGGPIQALNLPIHPDFRQIRLTPAEIRERFGKLGWKRIVGFQTRQPIHR